MRSSTILPNGNKIDPPDPFFHNLYRVTLKNGERWAVDTTGAQYGYPDPLCPWHDFEHHRSGKIFREYEFSYIRRKTYESFGMFPVRHMVAHKMEKQELAKALEDKISSWAQEHGGKLNAILIGSDATFKQAKDKFLEQLEDHLKVSMTKLYSPEQILKREKEVDCCRHLRAKRVGGTLSNVSHGVTRGMA
ncbi:hypothetical protein GMDG_01483 [Pseudogymnoascus destructans 20631-21]|uniref:Uncharacterized protein n=1 Tax=Pseudogymnoascus destructans (strain ATCC MYA-4855 / 20631-21) TaxID=658429 RepID=L8FU41_PSED2|nr:hypothetical protein GMDG_01483 [Pseudogymnoascus destructans 20631-21]